MTECAHTHTHTHTHTNTQELPVCIDLAMQISYIFKK